MLIFLLLAGFLNDLTDNSLGFGFNLLTRKDLIIILNKTSINHDNFRKIDNSIRIIKGSGDVIINYHQNSFERCVICWEVLCF